MQLTLWPMLERAIEYRPAPYLCDAEWYGGHIAPDNSYGVAFRAETKEQVIASLDEDEEIWRKGLDD